MKRTKKKRQNFNMNLQNIVRKPVVKFAPGRVVEINKLKMNILGEA